MLAALIAAVVAGVRGAGLQRLAGAGAAGQRGQTAIRDGETATHGGTRTTRSNASGAVMSLEARLRETPQ